PLADPLLQDRRRVHGLAGRPPGSLRDGRRPAVDATHPAPFGAVPACRCCRPARKPGTRVCADGAAAGHARPRRRGDPVSAAAGPGAADSRTGGAADQAAVQRAIAPPAPERLSLNTATVREQWNLRQMIEACARHGIRGISPWRDKLDELGAAQAARLIRQHGLTVTGLCRGGMFPAADAAGRRAAIDDNRRAIDDAATIGARCLVLVVGGIPAGSKDLPGARQMVIDGIAAVLDHARANRVPLAIEPLHPMYCADRACVNTLDQALDICDALDPRPAGAPPSGA